MKTIIYWNVFFKHPNEVNLSFDFCEMTIITKITPGFVNKLLG